MKHGHLWLLVKEPSSIVIETINIFIDYTMNKISNDIITEPNETKKEELRKNLEKYRKQQKSIDSSSYYSQLLKHLKTKLLDNSFIHKLDKALRDVMSRPNVPADQSGPDFCFF